MHAKQRTQYATFPETPGRRSDALFQNTHLALSMRPHGEVPVFHNRHVRITAEPVKHIFSDKQPLIPEHQGQRFGPPVGQPGNPPEVKPFAVVKIQGKAAADPALRQQMRTLLFNLQKQLKITTLLVTHDKEESMLLSDRIAVLFALQPEQVGTPEEIYHQPRTQNVANFFGKASYVDGMIKDGILQTEFYRCPVQAAEGPVHVLIRPEDVMAAEDGVPYEVTAREYLGDYCLYTLFRGDHNISMRTHPQVRHKEGVMLLAALYLTEPERFTNQEHKYALQPEQLQTGLLVPDDTGFLVNTPTLTPDPQLYQTLFTQIASLK